MTKKKNAPVKAGAAHTKSVKKNAVKPAALKSKSAGPDRSGGKAATAIERAEALFKEGKYAEAEAIAYERLSRTPADAPALRLYCACLTQEKKHTRHEALLAVCSEAVKHAPDDVEVLRLYAIALHRSGKSHEAFSTLMKRISLDPAAADRHLEVARFLREVKKPAEALKAYAQALKLKPDLIEATRELAALYKAQGKPGEAIACYRRAIEAAPDSASNHNNLGVLYGDVGKHKEAIACFEKAASLSPNSPSYFNNLGNTLYRVGRIAEACTAYARSLELKPDFMFALTQGLHACRQVCDWHTLAASVQKIREALKEEKSSGLAPFVLLSQPGINLEEIRLSALRFSQERFGRELRRIPMINTIKARARTNQKIRLGYLSADFHEHATSYLIVGALESHDHEKFEIYAYSYGPDDRSPTRERVKKTFDVFRDIQRLTDEQAARKIAEDGIDILIDLKGFTRDMRLGIQALRPAPVVVSWLGYPGTLGEPRLADYVIGDPTVTPLEHAPFYSEKLALMPHTYQPNDRSRQVAAIPSRAEAGLPENALVFCTFNQPYKITPDMLDLWCRIMVKVPESVLWLLEPRDQLAKENLCAEAVRRGVGADRIIFAARKPQAEHLARLSLADIALDTLPYASHTTCSDALWVGLPLLTLVGETFPARVAAGLLKTMNLPELVAQTGDEYVDKVVALARDSRKRSALRKKILRERETAPLFDTVRFTRDLEMLYRKMWKNHLSLHHDHIVPLSVALDAAKQAGEKPAPMKIAVVTPYFEETLEELRQCHESVLAQTVQCTHFMVADGRPRAEVDGWEVRHVKLPVSHGNGNTALGIGALLAAQEGFDAVAFLDADNWFYPEHLEKLVELHEKTLADVCIARRNMHRVDGSFMIEDGVSGGETLVDTSCYFVTRPAFSTLHYWARMIATGADRVYLKVLQSKGISLAVAEQPTLGYRTRWAAHYQSMGETPPEGSEARSQRARHAKALWGSLTPLQWQCWLGNDIRR